MIAFVARQFDDAWICFAQRNKALLDILESFSQNLEISIERLQAREQMLGFAQNDALDSIERDFRKAKEWLQVKGDLGIQMDSFAGF